MATLIGKKTDAEIQEDVLDEVGRRGGCSPREGR